MFFKTEVHYLVFLVEINGVQSLPEKFTSIKALEPPKDIEELRQFLGLVGFYRKFIPFFADVTACINTMLRKGVTVQWMEQCNNAFKLLKSELVKMPTLQYLNPNKPFKLFTDASKQSYSGIVHQGRTSKMPNTEAKLICMAQFEVLSVEPSSYGISHRRSVMQSTNPSKNLLFISLVQTVHYTVTISP